MSTARSPALVLRSLSAHSYLSEPPRKAAASESTSNPGETMVDVKERALFTFIGSVLLPVLLIASLLVYSTGVYKEPLRLVGLLTTAWWVMKLTVYFGKYLPLVLSEVAPFKAFAQKPDYVQKYGKWAIVTGATDGIGKAYAVELARRGMSVLIISRTRDKLVKEVENVKKEAAAAGKTVEADYLAYDFTNAAGADAFYAALKEKTDMMDKDGGIGALINNVGIANEVPEYMFMLDDTWTYNILRVNIDGTVRMTRAILPYMSERRRGFVINVSSGSGNQPTPLLAMYASTKAFVNEYSQCLHYEMKDFNVDVMGVTPYYVTSNMYKKDPSILNCSAERMVTDSLVVLGHYDISYPYVFHAILGNLMKIYWKTPQALMRSMKKTRARAAAKKAKEAPKDT